MEQQAPTSNTGGKIRKNVTEFRTSKTRQRLFSNTLSYFILILGTIFMLFPMLWMISASLKPSWQIFSEPIIWIPQKWEEVQAGETNRNFLLWRQHGHC